MVKSILDTDILSEYLKGHNPNVVNRASRYAQEHGVFTFTSITVYEIVYGLELKGAYAQVKRASAWLGQNEQITPEAADYVSAAMIKATARKNGLALELPDCLIAAVAVRLNRPLVTGNTQDFEAIQKTGVHLVLENWRNP
ncbi:MAG TPA: PIN domain-containing protein [Candidatus Angelobacter sp.]|nr:PIN domain-containing protein [Candidatus Angelobacter sp.]